uniref:RNase H type-1 domain-containing protein n=1 Tax=Strix occidentalis caurina TaxID=311401 RepID=A0A8D0EPB9_STROC
MSWLCPLPRSCPPRSTAGGKCRKEPWCCVSTTQQYATWSKWVALITQRARLGKPNRPGILEEIMDWPEGRDFGALPEEVARAQEAPPYNELPEDERRYALFTDGSCRVVGNHRKWKAAVWSPTRQVVEATEGEGESSQFAEVKAIQLALKIAEREKWPVLYLYTDSWMVANALWGWLQEWKKTNWGLLNSRGKNIRHAEEILRLLHKFIQENCIFHDNFGQRLYRCGSMESEFLCRTSSRDGSRK